MPITSLLLLTNITHLQGGSIESQNTFKELHHHCKVIHVQFAFNILILSNYNIMPLMDPLLSSGTTKFLFLIKRNGENWKIAPCHIRNNSIFHPLQGGHLIILSHLPPSTENEPQNRNSCNTKPPPPS